MKISTQKIEIIINTLEKTTISFPLWIGAFLSIIFFRILIENWLGNFAYRDVQFLFSEFTHTFLFFLFSYGLFLFLLSIATRQKITSVASIVLWGFLIILSPPILDFFISQGKGFWSFYQFDSLQGLLQRFFTFFGDSPTLGITYGVRIEVALSLLFFAVYVYVKTKKIFRTFAMTFFAYVLFFILGTFPSWITIAILGLSKGFMEVTSVDIAGMFLSPETSLSYTPGSIMNTLNVKMSIIYAIILMHVIPFFLFLVNKEKMIKILSNIRWPQTLYHAGLVYVGAGIAILFSPQSLTHFTLFNVLSLIILTYCAIVAWATSVVSNDFFDEPIDTITNPHRPLVEKTITKSAYKQLGWTLFFASLLLAGIAHPYGIALIMVYHALTWLYNAPPFRLKQFPFIATFLGSLASFLILLLGYVAFDASKTTVHIPWEIITLLLFSYTITLPLKDLKDIKGDKKMNIFTLPVLLGEKKARLIIASGVFFSFVLSVYVLNAKNLIFVALLFGSLCFYLISTKKLSFFRVRITPRNLPGILIGLVFLYTLLLFLQIAKIL